MPELNEEYDQIKEISPRVLELSPEQESILEQNIVWIFGSRRSGTTWLRDLLSYDTRYIRETYITEHLAAHSQADYFVRRFDEVKYKKNYFFADAYKNTWKHYLGKLILYRIYAEVQDYTHKIIVKEPSSYLDASDIISQCTTQSKAIIILRDGRDVLDSLIDGRSVGGWLSADVSNAITQKDRISFIEQSSKWWIKQIEVLLETYNILPKEQRFLVHYEDLLENTFELLQKIYAFIGIQISDNKIYDIINKFSFENISPELKGKGKFYRMAKPGSWKINFNDDEKQLMNKIMGDVLMKLGYEL